MANLIYRVRTSGYSSDTLVHIHWLDSKLKLLDQAECSESHWFLCLIRDLILRVC